MLNFDNITEDLNCELNLEDMQEIAYRAFLEMPQIERLGGDMITPQMLGDTQYDDIIANAIMQQVLLHRWPDMPDACIWQLSYRLQYAKDTLHKLIELEESYSFPVVHACAVIALTAAYMWHVNAALWVGDYCAADAITNDVDAWPALAGAEYPMLEILIKRYQYQLEKGR